MPSKALGLQDMDQPSIGGAWTMGPKEREQAGSKSIRWAANLGLQGEPKKENQTDRQHRETNPFLYAQL